MRLFLFTVLAFACGLSKVASDQHPFITGKLLGGLGNMLFQIATTSSVAWDQNVEVYFPLLMDVPDLKTHVFSRCKVMPPSNEISMSVGESSLALIFENKMRLEGYFQEERYFSHHREKLMKLFAPLPSDLRYIKKKYGKILHQPNTVGIQVRFYRREVVEGYPQYGRRYLEKAMAMFPSDSQFIVSSDNLDYARSHIPSWAKNVIFLSNEKNYIDLYILSLCKNNIISNSSFGWWAAWLNQNPDKTVVCPAYWTGYSSEGIYPKDWIRVEAEPEDL